MNTSNVNNHELLKMQDNPEDYIDEHLESMVDSIDEVPDVENEWKKFEEAYLHESNSNRNYVWVKKAASVIAAVLLIGIAYAASVATGIMPNVLSIYNEDVQTDDALSCETTSSINPETQNETTVVLFDNVTLENIASEFSAYYNIKVEFNDAKAKGTRLYFNWDKSASLEDNIAVLNAFEKINIRLKDNTLIVE